MTHMRLLSSVCWLCGSLAATCGAFAQDSAPPVMHVLTIEDLLAVQHVARVDLAPNAKQVLLVTQGVSLASNAPVFKVYVAATRGDGDLLPLPPEAAQAQWQADSKALTFLRPSGECTQLWQIAITTRQSARLGETCLPSKDRTLISYRWSADGRFLAYLSQPVTQDALAAFSAKATALKQDERSAACIEINSEEAHAKGIDALDLACSGTSVGTGWMWGFDVASPAFRFFSTTQTTLPPTELWVFDAASGTPHRVSADGADVRQFDWSARGHHLIWFALARNDKKDEKAPYAQGSGSMMSFGGNGSISWSDAAVDSVPRSLSVGALSAIDLFVLGLKWSPSESRAAFGTYSSLRVYGTPLAAAAMPKELVTGRTTQFDWSADGRSLYLLRSEHHLQSLKRIDIASGAVRDASNDPRWHGKPSFSADHRVFAIAVEDVTEPTQVYLGNDSSTALRRVVGHGSLNPHWLKVAPLVQGRIDWRSWDDKWNLYGVTVAPKGGEPKSRPMVVVILGAGFPTLRQFGMDTQQPILLLAAAGYTVFIPNDRSRSGISPKGYEDLGEERTYFSKPWKDDMQGIDLMVSRGLADPERIGIMGNSYGGGLTAWGIAHSTRFKAAVLKEPVAMDMGASWRGVWGHKGFGGDVIGKQYGIDSVYEGDGKKFIDGESPISTVSAVRTPTLMEYGVKSGNIQLGGNEFYQALVWYGVPAELVMYPRTIHGFIEPALVADSFRRELKWFGQWLPAN